MPSSVGTATFMDKVAVVLWLMTALVGGYMFAHTLRHRESGSGAVASRMPTTIFFHPVGAILGVTFLLIYAAGGPASTAWTAFGVLVATAAFGEYFFVRWLRDRRRLAEPRLIAEQQIPPLAVGLHGLLATATLVTTLVVAIQA